MKIKQKMYMNETLHKELEKRRKRSVRNLMFKKNFCKFLNNMVTNRALAFTSKISRIICFIYRKIFFHVDTTTYK